LMPKLTTARLPEPRPGQGKAPRPGPSSNVRDAPTLVPCAICGRTFAEDRLEKHETICRNSSSKKRKVFQPQREYTVGDKEISAAALLSKQRPAPKQKPKKDSNWRAQSQAFQEAMRAARGETSPPPPPQGRQNKRPPPRSRPASVRRTATRAGPSGVPRQNTPSTARVSARSTGRGAEVDAEFDVDLRSQGRRKTGARNSGRAADVHADVTVDLRGSRNPPGEPTYRAPTATATVKANLTKADSAKPPQSPTSVSGTASTPRAPMSSEQLRKERMQQMQQRPASPCSDRKGSEGATRRAPSARRSNSFVEPSSSTPSAPRKPPLSPRGGTLTSPRGQPKRGLTNDSLQVPGTPRGSVAGSIASEASPRASGRVWPEDSLQVPCASSPRCAARARTPHRAGTPQHARTPQPRASRARTPQRVPVEERRRTSRAGSFSEAPPPCAQRARTPNPRAGPKPAPPSRAGTEESLSSTRAPRTPRKDSAQAPTYVEDSPVTAKKPPRPQRCGTEDSLQVPNTQTPRGNKASASPTYHEAPVPSPEPTFHEIEEPTPPRASSSAPRARKDAASSRPTKLAAPKMPPRAWQCDDGFGGGRNSELKAPASPSRHAEGISGGSGNKNCADYVDWDRPARSKSRDAAASNTNSKNVAEYYDWGPPASPRGCMGGTGNVCSDYNDWSPAPNSGRMSVPPQSNWQESGLSSPRSTVGGRSQAQQWQQPQPQPQTHSWVSPHCQTNSWQPPASQNYNSDYGHNNYNREGPSRWEAPELSSPRRVPQSGNGGAYGGWDAHDSHAFQSRENAQQPTNRTTVRVQAPPGGASSLVLG